MTKLDTIIQADALEFCSHVETQSIDMILCDLPYGTTQCSWDAVIPFEPMWRVFKRIIKVGGVIALTASQPFTSALTMSNLKMFRYEWIWRKSGGSNFLDANRKPIKVHESVLIFGVSPCNYYPQMGSGKSYRLDTGSQTKVYGNFKKVESISDGERYPVSVFEFPVEHGLHPTQKPVGLFEYLIRTYTREGEVVLDCCCGSGTTALAARKANRHWLCCDSDAGYVAAANERLANSDPFQTRQVGAMAQPSLFAAVAE